MRTANIISRNAVILSICALLAACGGGAGGGGAGGGAAVPAPLPAQSLAVVATSIPEGALAVDPRASLSIAFSGTFPASGLGSNQVQLSDGISNHPLKIDIANGTLTVTPIGSLHTRTDYRLTVKAGTTAADGSVLKNDFVLKFRTLLAVYDTKQLTPADPSVSSSGSDVPRLRIADINGDGRADLVELAGLYRLDLFAANGYVINIFLQNADGGFDKLQKLEYIVNQSVYSKYFNGLIVLDVDGDNKPELLVPEFMGNDVLAEGIRVFKAGADGKFAAKEFIATNYTERIEALDIDGDGKLDLLGSSRHAIDQVTGGFQVMLRRDAGFTLLSPVNLIGGAYEFGIADLDQDGKRELIVNHPFAKSNGPTASGLQIFSQGSAGVFSLNTALTNETIGFCSNSEYCQDMKISDLNGDGKPELFFRTQAADTDNLILAFSRQAGGPLIKNFQVSIGYDARIFGIQDLDGDGVPDLLVVASSGFYSVIGGGPNFAFEFSNRIRLPVLNTMYPHNVAIGDIDGDGRPDIVFDSSSSGIVLARSVKY